jgi:hypothetical protein
VNPNEGSPLPTEAAIANNMRNALRAVWLRCTTKHYDTPRASIGVGSSADVDRFEANRFKTVLFSADSGSSDGEEKEASIDVNGTQVHMSLLPAPPAPVMVNNPSSDQQLRASLNESESAAGNEQATEPVQPSSSTAASSSAAPAAPATPLGTGSNTAGSDNAGTHYFDEAEFLLYNTAAILTPQVAQMCVSVALAGRGPAEVMQTQHRQTHRQQQQQQERINQHPLHQHPLHQHQYPQLFCVSSVNGSIGVRPSLGDAVAASRGLVGSYPLPVTADVVTVMDPRYSAHSAGSSGSSGSGSGPVAAAALVLASSRDQGKAFIRPSESIQVAEWLQERLCRQIGALYRCLQYGSVVPGISLVHSSAYLELGWSLQAQAESKLQRRRQLLKASRKKKKEKNRETNNKKALVASPRKKVKLDAGSKSGCRSGSSNGSDNSGVNILQADFSDGSGSEEEENDDEDEDDGEKEEGEEEDEEGGGAMGGPSYTSYSSYSSSSSKPSSAGGYRYGGVRAVSKPDTHMRLATSLHAGAVHDVVQAAVHLLDPALECVEPLLGGSTLPSGTDSSSSSSSSSNIAGSKTPKRKGVRFVDDADKNSADGIDDLPNSNVHNASGSFSYDATIIAEQKRFLTLFPHTAQYPLTDNYPLVQDTKRGSSRFLQQNILCAESQKKSK